MHVIVCHAPAFRIFLCHLFVGWLWVAGYDVPGVEETGEEAETAEGEVDEGVGGAETAFYPDGDAGRDVSVVCFLFCFLFFFCFFLCFSFRFFLSCFFLFYHWNGSCAYGGKIMAIMPRKMSLPHMMVV